MPHRTKIKAFYSREHGGMRYKAEFFSNTGQYDAKICGSSLEASNWLGRKAKEPTRKPDREYPEFPVKRKRNRSRQAEENHDGE